MSPRKSAAKKAARDRRKGAGTKRAPSEAGAAGKRSGFSLPDDLVEKLLLAPGDERSRSKSESEQLDLAVEYFGEVEFRELRELATRARQVRAKSKHRVLILPGIMGSKLGLERGPFDNCFWIEPVDLLLGNLRKLSLADGNPEITSIGVFLFAYLKLKMTLRAAGFDADFHHFDWRRGLNPLGTELADRLQVLWDDGVESVSLVAHSMGGLVSRMALRRIAGRGEEGKHLDRMVQRVIMLGTPNFGSFAPLVAYCGKHATIGKVAALSGSTGLEFMREVGSTFPGLCQMLPFPERFNEIDFYGSGDAWRHVPAPPPATMLTKARGAQAKLHPGDERFVMVAGVDQETVVNARLAGGEYRFFSSPNGDGTVPLAFAKLPGIKTYYVEAEHGSMANNRMICRGVSEILNHREPEGFATEHEERDGVEREVEFRKFTPEEAKRSTGGAGLRSARFLLEEFVSPGRDESVMAPVATGGGAAARDKDFSKEAVRVGRARQYGVELGVVQGSITELDTRAVVIGVFQDVTPTGAGLAIDTALDGALRNVSQRRMFNAGVGEIFIFPTLRKRLPTEMVILAGLGRFDEFNDEAQALVAEQIARTAMSAHLEEFGTVLIGAGCSRDIDTALKNMIEGFVRGIRDELDPGERHRVRSIMICELDPDRRDEIHSAALRLARTPLLDEIEITVRPPEFLPEGRRLDPTRIRRQAFAKDPVYLHVEHTRRPKARFVEYEVSLLTAGGKATVLTERSRVGREDHQSLLGRIDGFVNGEASRADLADLGLSMSELLLPGLIREALVANRDRYVVLIHDAQCSKMPWEALRINPGDSREPAAAWMPAAESGLSRRYSVAGMPLAKWLERRRREAGLRVLLVFNPNADDSENALPGTEVEAREIRALAGEGDSQIEVTSVGGGDATKARILEELRSGKYDVFHYAGHAYFDPENRTESGMICNQDEVLRGSDLKDMDNLPSLAVVNACEGGRLRSRKALKKNVKNRSEVNIGLAESILRGGIANYVSTYWPVGDASAAQFATEFYREIFKGEAVGAAATTARKALREGKSVDWADYIHYGDPAFVVKL